MSSAAPFTWSLSQAILFGLLATRMGALFIAAPPLGGRAVPMPARWAVVATFAWCLTEWHMRHDPAAGAAVTAWSAWDLAAAVANEAATGAAMGLGLHLAFAAYAQAARMLDTQVGYGIGQVLDPVTRRQAPVLTGLFGHLATVLFFTTDAAQGVFRGVALSVDLIPPGRAWPAARAFDVVVREASGLFTLGFAMVAPVVFALLLVELALGVISRSMPQMNMFAMGIPVKVLVVLAALALWLTSGTGLLGRAQVEVLRGWEAMFRS